MERTNHSNANFDGQCGKHYRYYRNGRGVAGGQGGDSVRQYVEPAFRGGNEWVVESNSVRDQRASESAAIGIVHIAELRGGGRCFVHFDSYGEQFSADF